MAFLDQQKTDPNDPFNFKKYGAVRGSMTFHPDGSVKSLNSPDFIQLLNALSVTPQAGPQDAEIIRQNAEAERLQGYGNVLSGLPPTQMPQFQPEPMPQRAIPRPPREDRPSINPIAGVIGLLAGGALPDAAGAVQSSMLQGAHAAAQESMAQRAQTYQQQADLSAAIYNDQLNARNEVNKYRLLNQDREFKNAELQREWKGDVGKLNVDAQVPNTISRGLTALNEKQKQDTAAQNKVSTTIQGIGLNQAQQGLDTEANYKGAAAEHLRAQTSTENELRPIRKDEATHQAEATKWTAKSAELKAQTDQINMEYARDRAKLEQEILVAEKEGRLTDVATKKKALQYMDQDHALKVQETQANISLMNSQAGLASANAALARAGIPMKITSEGIQNFRLLTAIGDDNSKNALQFYSDVSKRVQEANAAVAAIERQFLTHDAKGVYARDTTMSGYFGLPRKPTDAERRDNMMKSPEWIAAHAAQADAAADLKKAQEQLHAATLRAVDIYNTARQKTGLSLPGYPGLSGAADNMGGASAKGAPPPPKGKSKSLAQILKENNASVVK